jgi:hypothetical protein
MWKKVAITSILLWVATVGFIAYKLKYGNAKVVDKRIEISLAPEQRELVLGEMRTLLEGVKGIVRGAATDDKELMRVSAKNVGMQMAQDVNPALIAKLPLEFKALGMGVHKDFDILAAKTHTLTTKEILSELDGIMNSCIGCHSTYKITENSTRN